MPSIIGSIPDKEVKPVIKYILLVDDRLPGTDYNEALLCLLLAWKDRQ